MSMAALLAGAIVTAKGALGDLLVDVTHHPAGGTRNADAEPVPGTDVVRQAVVEYREKTVRMMDRDVQIVAVLTFVEPVGVTYDDAFTLPNGQRVPVATINGVVSADAGSGLLFTTTVGLGRSGGE